MPPPNNTVAGDDQSRSPTRRRPSPSPGCRDQSAAGRELGGGEDQLYKLGKRPFLKKTEPTRFQGKNEIQSKIRILLPSWELKNPKNEEKHLKPFQTQISTFQ
jgi:hypothetical protein